MEKVAAQVSQLHTHVLGVEGQGGLTREVQALRSDTVLITQDLQKVKTNLTGFKGRVLGAAAIISILVPVIINHFFSK